MLSFLAVVDAVLTDTVVQFHFLHALSVLISYGNQSSNTHSFEPISMRLLRCCHRTEIFPLIAKIILQILVDWTN